jgi:hypothetical protein
MNVGIGNEAAQFNFCPVWEYINWIFGAVYVYSVGKKRTWKEDK